MFCSSRDDRLWLGLVAFLLGAVILLQKFELVPAETFGFLWPSILVVSGLRYMLASRESCWCDDDVEFCSCDNADCDGACMMDSCCGEDCLCEDCECDPCVCSVQPAEKPTSKSTSKSVKKSKK